MKLAVCLIEFVTVHSVTWGRNACAIQYACLDIEYTRLWNYMIHIRVQVDCVGTVLDASASTVMQ